MNPAANDSDFFNRLSTRSQVIVLSAVFALFAPLPLLIASPIGRGFSWYQIVAWFALGGLIATIWAFAFFKQRHRWLPPIATVLLSVAFPIVRQWTGGEPVSSTLPVSIIAVVMVVIGYVGFVMFIGIEGTKMVRIQAEMSIARKIHSYLVPDITFHNTTYEISGISIASTEMGGDVTDVTEVDGQVCVTIADVSGHGVPAGILMAALKGSLLTSLSSGNLNTGDGTFLNKVNSTFHRISSPEMYCTLTTVILNPDRTCLVYNSGHVDTLHYRSASKTVDSIPSSGIPVGVMADSLCDVRRIEVQPGDVLALLTDGITETVDTGGKMLGTDPILRLLPGVAGSSALEISQSVFSHASAFGVSDDDRSVLIIKVK